MEKDDFAREFSLTGKLENGKSTDKSDGYSDFGESGLKKIESRVNDFGLICSKGLSVDTKPKLGRLELSNLSCSLENLHSYGEKAKYPERPAQRVLLAAGSNRDVICQRQWFELLFDRKHRLCPEQYRTCRRLHEHRPSFRRQRTDLRWAHQIRQ